MTGLVLRDARLRDGSRADVHVSDGVIANVLPPGGPVPGEVDDVVEAHGGMLLPGLHDHHMHLMAAAAAHHSASCGPPHVNTPDQFGEALRQASEGTEPGTWVRGVGYHESVAGDLDRDRLDALVPHRPVRVQHRSGVLWILNGAGLKEIEAEAGSTPPGVERDGTGRATGRIWRHDEWLRERLGPASPPDLADLGSKLAQWGVTGVTDATPDMGGRLRPLLDAVVSGALPQRLHLLGVDELPGDAPAAAALRVSVGPRKLVLPDEDLPDLPDLVSQIRAARSTAPSGRRPVAVHCVTRVALVLLCAALGEVGTVPGDRIEHASVVPAPMLPIVRRLGLTVVTQPGLVAERGDEYLRSVHPDDLPGLYRHASLLRAGVPVAVSSDAPYAGADPWETIRAACTRRTRGGAVLGADERVRPDAALDGFIAPADDPGGPPRTVSVGAPADLVLLEPGTAIADLATLQPTVVASVCSGMVVG